MVDGFEDLARDELDHVSARKAIWRALDNAGNGPKAYAALCRWTWRAVIERRFDEELRSWHRLLLDTAGRVEAGAEAAPTGRGRPRLDGAAAAERIRALADLVRLSVDASDVSDVKHLTARAHVQEILRLLADHPGRYLERGNIKSELGLGDANLSRVMTLLAANGLVDRLTRGKTAAFSIAQRGISLIESTEKVEGRVFVPTVVPAHLVRAQSPTNAEYGIFKPGQLIVCKPGHVSGHQTTGTVGSGQLQQEPVYSSPNIYHIETTSGSGSHARARPDRPVR